jgi:hypothetical protein
LQDYENDIRKDGYLKKRIISFIFIFVLLVSCFVTSLIFKPVDESDTADSDEKTDSEEKTPVVAEEKADVSDEEE